MDEPDNYYESPTPYQEARIHAAAIYCSDGRIGDQIDEFLHHGLGLPRYDRLALPGGPVALASRATAYWEGVALENQLRFLIQVHRLEQLVLIAHSTCAYYRERLAIPQSVTEAEQVKDLALAASVVRRLSSEIHVHCFFARPYGPRIRFELVSSTTSSSVKPASPAAKPTR